MLRLRRDAVFELRIERQNRGSGRAGALHVVLGHYPHFVGHNFGRHLGALDPFDHATNRFGRSVNVALDHELEILGLSRRDIGEQRFH